MAGLTQLGDEGRAELEGLVSTAPTAELRASAASTLGLSGVGDPLSRASLQTAALDDASPEVRTAAIRALSGGSSVEAMDALAQVVSQGATAADRAFADERLERMEVRVGAPELMAQYFSDERHPLAAASRPAH